MFFLTQLAVILSEPKGKSQNLPKNSYFRVQQIKQLSTLDKIDKYFILIKLCGFRETPSEKYIAIRILQSYRPDHTIPQISVTLDGTLKIEAEDITASTDLEGLLMTKKLKIGSLSLSVLR